MLLQRYSFKCICVVNLFVMKLVVLFVVTCCDVTAFSSGGFKLEISLMHETETAAVNLHTKMQRAACLQL